MVRRMLIVENRSLGRQPDPEVNHGRCLENTIANQQTSETKVAFPSIIKKGASSPPVNYYNKAVDSIQQKIVE